MPTTASAMGGGTREDDIVDILVRDEIGKCGVELNEKKKKGMLQKREVKKKKLKQRGKQGSRKSRQCSPSLSLASSHTVTVTKSVMYLNECFSFPSVAV